MYFAFYAPSRPGKREENREHYAVRLNAGARSEAYHWRLRKQSRLWSGQWSRRELTVEFHGSRCWKRSPPPNTRRRNQYTTSRKAVRAR